MDKSRRLLHFAIVATALGSTACGGNGWRDPAAHVTRFVRTRDGTQLHVLDWGGSGPAVVLLAGLGSSAHTFDDLIPRLDHRFRYVAVTRRGTGESDRPERGYDIATRVRDDVDVLAALGIVQCVFVGHSIAGTELTVLGAEHPERVRGLVYLDAAYDRYGPRSVAGSPPAFPKIEVVATDFPSLLRLREHSRYGLGAAYRSDIEVTERGRDNSLIPSPPMDVRQAMLDAERTFHPHYGKILAPMLAIYAFSPHTPAGEDLKLDDSTRAVQDAWWVQHDWPWRQMQVQQFRAEAQHGTVLVLNPADHVVYLSNAPQVAQAMNAFLAALGTPR